MKDFLNNLIKEKQSEKQQLNTQALKIAIEHFKKATGFYYHEIANEEQGSECGYYCPKSASDRYECWIDTVDDSVYLVRPAYYRRDYDFITLGTIKGISKQVRDIVTLDYDINMFKAFLDQETRQDTEE